VLTEPDAQDPDIRNLDFHKNQYGPKSESIQVKWKDGLFLPVEAKADYERAAHDATAERVFLDLARKAQSHGQTMSPNRTAHNNPGKLFENDPAVKENKLKKADIMSAMERLLDAKKLILFTVGRYTYLRVP
jgi:hypothetical protein